MKFRDLIVVGGGEHGRCVYEAAQLAKRSVIGFLDKQEGNISPYLGTDAAVGNYPEAELILGVGMTGENTYRPDIRSVIVSKMPDRWGIVIHPTAIVSPSAKIGRGAVIMAGAIINAGAEIGMHSIINTGAIVEHDCKIGDFTHLCPGVVMGGGTTIGRNCFVGVGASLRDHIRVGDYEFIPMHSTVVRDITDETHRQSA